MAGPSRRPNRDTKSSWVNIKNDSPSIFYNIINKDVIDNIYY